MFNPVPTVSPDVLLRKLSEHPKIRVAVPELLSAEELTDPNVARYRIFQHLRAAIDLSQYYKDPSMRSQLATFVQGVIIGMQECNYATVETQPSE